MTSALKKLRAAVEAMTPATWFARGQHISRVPDNTGMEDS